MNNPVEFFAATRSSIERSESNRDPLRLTKEELARMGGTGKSRGKKKAMATVPADPDETDDGSLRPGDGVVDESTPEHISSTQLGSDLGIFRDHHEFISSMISEDTFQKLKLAVEQWHGQVAKFNPQLNPQAEINKLKGEIGGCSCPEKFQELNSRLSGIKNQDLSVRFTAEGVCNRHLSEVVDPLVDQAWREIFAGLIARFEQAKSFETVFFAAFGMPWHRTLVFETLETISDLAKRQHAMTGHWVDPETCMIPRRSLGLHRPECASWLLAGRES